MGGSLRFELPFGPPEYCRRPSYASPGTWSGFGRMASA
jgi:hypothetical protein